MAMRNTMLDSFVRTLGLVERLEELRRGRDWHVVEAAAAAWLRY